ncbi:hypothetical protein MVEN_02197500 [Mycena venus]|uniref:Uncharacterized protein n=1 Tax=Mycena venus TaxID=2733690 RepID=A0A8H7CHB7_9AGAR|nr:hypothetical protein MVEN_02197500 [Mycena venus]
MQRTGTLSFSSFSRLASALIFRLQISRMCFLLFSILILISWLPTPCMTLQLGAPWPTDQAQSMSIFTGGMLSLSWTLNSSDPEIFDLVLVATSGDTKSFPGIPSAGRGVSMLFTSPPQTGATLAESSTFEVTAKPSIISASATVAGAPPSTEASFISLWPTSTGVLAIPVSTQSPSPQARTKLARGTLVGAIAGTVAGSAIIVVGLIWLFCARRRRAAPTGPVLIDDDGVSKVESEALSLPVCAQLSPFTMGPTRLAPPRLAPLRVADLRLVSSQRPTSNYHNSSGYYPASLASTHRTPVDIRHPISSYKPVSYQRDPPSPASTHRPTLSTQLASYKRDPTSRATSPASPYRPTSSCKSVSYQRDPPSRVTSPASPHRPAANYKGVSYHHAPHHRKLSYDLPPSSPLTKAALSSKDRRTSFDQRRATLLPTATQQRLEQQVELETALSETVYDNEEEADDKQADPETRAKTPTRRRPLRLRTIGSSDGHELDEMSQQHGSEYLSTETGGRHGTQHNCFYDALKN